PLLLATGVKLMRLAPTAIRIAITDSLLQIPASERPADVASSQRHINVAATGADIGPSIKRLAPLPGYRWVVINAGDLFTSSPLTIGTKVGIMDPTGRVLKNADLPRPK